MITKQHFSQAADIIEANGKSYGTFYEKGCGFCTVGALAVASGYAATPSKKEAKYLSLEWKSDVCADVDDMFNKEPVVKSFMEHIGVSYDSGVYNWSDNSTLTEVVATLREFANSQ